MSDSRPYIPGFRREFVQSRLLWKGSNVYGREWYKQYAPPFM